MMHKKESKLPALERDPPAVATMQGKGRQAPPAPPEIWTGPGPGEIRPGASWTRQGPAPVDAWTGGDMPPAPAVAVAAGLKWYVIYTVMYTVREVRPPRDLIVSYQLHI